MFTVSNVDQCSMWSAWYSTVVEISEHACASLPVARLNERGGCLWDQRGKPQRGCAHGGGALDDHPVNGYEQHSRSTRVPGMALCRLWRDDGTRPRRESERYALARAQKDSSSVSCCRLHVIGSAGGSQTVAEPEQLIIFPKNRTGETAGSGEKGHQLQIDEGTTVETISTVRAHILSAIRTIPEYEFDDLAKTFPEFTCNQLFLEIDQLSHTGEVQLTQPQFCRFILKVGPKGVTPIDSLR